MSITSSKFYLPASQNQSYGTVDPEAVRAICNKINTYRPSGIKAHVTSINSYISGGTCSALSFSFIKRYLEHKQSTSAKPQDIIATLAPIFSKGATLEHRVQQAAFNLIYRKRKEVCSDFLRTKMQALANYYDLYIQDCTPLVKVPSYFSYMEEKDSTLEDQLPSDSITSIATQALSNLQCGVYLIRAIKPSSFNKKQESYGHSMAFIKERNYSVFYDPSHCIREIDQKNEAKELADAIIEGTACYNLYNFRLYKLDEKRTGTIQEIFDNTLAA